jgi:hypothetical protein
MPTALELSREGWQYYLKRAKRVILLGSLVRLPQFERIMKE